MPDPKTKQDPVVEEHFGHTITDPYRWLENDIRSDEQVSRWVDGYPECQHNLGVTSAGRQAM
jgi:prolyl oligopeptidase